MLALIKMSFYFSNLHDVEAGTEQVESRFQHCRDGQQSAPGTTPHSNHMLISNACSSPIEAREPSICSLNMWFSKPNKLQMKKSQLTRSCSKASSYQRNGLGWWRHGRCLPARCLRDRCLWSWPGPPPGMPNWNQREHLIKASFSIVMFSSNSSCDYSCAFLIFLIPSQHLEDHHSNERYQWMR